VFSWASTGPTPLVLTHDPLFFPSRLDRVHLRRQSEYSQNEVLRPGFVRINLSYVIPDDEADFVIDAVAMVAEKGWRLLPQYMFNPETGEWRHIKHKVVCCWF